MPSQEEARLAVKKFNQSCTHLVTHMPGRFVHTYDRLKLTKKDVVVVGYPKSGTQWLAQICHQIKTRVGNKIRQFQGIFKDFASTIRTFCQFFSAMNAI